MSFEYIFLLYDVEMVDIIILELWREVKVPLTSPRKWHPNKINHFLKDKTTNHLQNNTYDKER